MSEFEEWTKPYQEQYRRSKEDRAAEGKFALTGGPPAHWYNLDVLHKGEKTELMVVEIDLVDGYIRHHPKGPDGRCVVVNDEHGVPMCKVERIEIDGSEWTIVDRERGE